VSAEREAARHGLRRLTVVATPSSAALLRGAGYREDRARPGHWRKSMSARLGAQRRAWLALADGLGIPADYGAQRGLPLQRVPRRLVALGQDCFGRDQRATPGTARAWHALRDAARADGVSLRLVSAFRDPHYQADLLRRKLDAGQALDRILRVSAAPGYSEHHSGRALDLATSDSPPLEPAFASTRAYAWLQRRAGDFGFIESYPRDNPHGIDWEPWHWCWQPR
jgi:D-alanyl-D-alanine carboxypeptidase